MLWKKPIAKETDKDYMHSINHSPALKGDSKKKIQELEKRKYDKYLIAPFNNDKWTKFN